MSFENCVCVSDLAAQSMAKCTISTFLNYYDAIMAADVAKVVTVVYSKHIMDEVENLLLIWIEEKELLGNSISEGIICKKALSNYADLVKETPSTSAEGESVFDFKVSRGWLKNSNIDV